MNALDLETKEAVGEVFRELNKKCREIRAAILHGAGEKAFAAGADIKVFTQLTPELAKEHLARTHRVYTIVENFERPVIAAIHGFCLGGGLELALSCDIRCAAEKAKLGFPEVNLSVFPGGGGIQRALSHLPLGKLKELVYTGDFLSAREALSWGLVEKVVPDRQLMDTAMDLAKKIVAKGPLGIGAAKKTINRSRDLSLEQGLELERTLWSDLAATEDMKEGARAFLEKRKPVYQCR